MIREMVRLRKMNKTKLLIMVVFGYALLSFTFSFLGFLAPKGFLHPKGENHLPEYTPTTLVEELGGHFMFSLLAAFPLLDGSLILVTGILGLVIDTDHILAASGLPVAAQPSHSILFVTLATFFLIEIAKGFRPLIKLTAVAPVAALSHLAYDIFAARMLLGLPGAEFPFLLPFSFRNIYLPFRAWIPFETSAAVVALMSYAYSKSYRGKSARLNLYSNHRKK